MVCGCEVKSHSASFIIVCLRFVLSFFCYQHQQVASVLTIELQKLCSTITVYRKWMFIWVRLQDCNFFKVLWCRHLSLLRILYSFFFFLSSIQLSYWIFSLFLLPWNKHNQLKILTQLCTVVAQFIPKHFCSVHFDKKNRDVRNFSWTLSVRDIGPTCCKYLSDTGWHRLQQTRWWSAAAWLAASCKQTIPCRPVAETVKPSLV